MTNDDADLQDSIVDADGVADECGPAAEGILRCLQMLADEAAELRLPHTVEALHHAIAACAVEAAEIADSQGRPVDDEPPSAARYALITPVAGRVPIAAPLPRPLPNRARTATVRRHRPRPRPRRGSGRGGWGCR